MIVKETSIILLLIMTIVRKRFKNEGGECDVKYRDDNRVVAYVGEIQ